MVQGVRRTRAQGLRGLPESTYSILISCLLKGASALALHTVKEWNTGSGILSLQHDEMKI